MKKYSIFLILIVFFMLYHPPLFKVNSLHIVGLISWIYILFNWKSIKSIIFREKILRIFIFFSLIMTYVFLVAYINDNSLQIVATYLYWIMDVLPGGIVITNICLKKNYSIISLITLLLIVGNIQGLLALLTFILPNFQLYFIEKMVSYGYEDRLLNLSSYRMFGISAALTFTTPIIQGMFAMLAIFLSIRVNSKYLLFVPLLIFSSLINARTPIVIILLGFVILFILMIRDRKKIIKSFTFISILIVGILIILNFIKKYSPSTYVWINNGFLEIKSFLKGDNIGYFTYVSDESKYRLPEGFNLFFGKGVRPLGENSYNTDIGWINDIWVAGILVSTILYLLFLKLFFELYLCKGEYSTLYKFIAMFFGITLILGNFKGAIFMENEVTTVLFLIYIFVLSKSFLEKNKKLDLKLNKIN